MNKNISLDDIVIFKKQYDNNKENKIIENKIREFGIKEACLNKNNYKYEFNLELPDIKIYNQFNSHQCNIYAFLRVVKDILRKNTDLDVDNLNISANYIAFFDKLEKINVLYNKLIDLEFISPGNVNNYVNKYIGSFGTFHFCREIVNKYGLCLSKDMPDVDPNFDDSLNNELLREKIKIDAMSLNELKTKEEKVVYKKELLYKAYEFLSKIYGNPPSIFFLNQEEFTPLEFKNTYLKDHLDSFVTVTNLNKEELINSYSYIPNYYLEDNEEIITLEQKEISKVILKQLKDGISIWFSSEESTTSDYENGVLDDKVYNFEKMLNIGHMQRVEKIKLDIINYDHAMCITGAFIKNNKLKQLKVDNSFGKYGKYKGHFIMTPSYLENSVITLIINKKYLPGFR